MSYKASDKIDPKIQVNVRTDYRCKAHGCPNAGSIEDLCYWHFRESDPAKWGNLTARIRMNFEKMRNY